MVAKPPAEGHNACTFKRSPLGVGGRRDHPRNNTMPSTFATNKGVSAMMDPGFKADVQSPMMLLRRIET